MRWAAIGAISSSIIGSGRTQIKQAAYADVQTLSGGVGWQQCWPGHVCSIGPIVRIWWSFLGIFVPPDSHGFAVQPAQGHHENQRHRQEKRDPADPVLDQADAGPQEVTERDRRHGPGGSAQDVVKGELSPGHKTHACDERPKDPQARYKARQEYRSPPVPLEKPLGASQALGRDKGVPTPPQHKRAPAEATDTISYLSPHIGSEAAQHHCFP